jgi:hypothetical protein
MPNPYGLWFFLLARQLLFDALFDLAMITPTLGFCATLFDPVHDIVAVGPFANSIGHFLRAGFRTVVPFHSWHILKLYCF